MFCVFLCVFVFFFADTGLGEENIILSLLDGFWHLNARIESIDSPRLGDFVGTSSTNPHETALVH